VTKRKKTVIREEFLPLWQITNDLRSVITKVESDEPSYRVFNSLIDAAQELKLAADKIIDQCLQEVA
jgi:hypothetical protein